MKKYYSIFAMLAMMVVALSFIACGDDDDDGANGGGGSSSLVGTWDIVSTAYYMEGYEPEYEEGNGEYWVFTANKMTVHDPTDLMNGVAADYTYRNGKWSIDGLSIYTVTELTSNKLVIKSEAIYGGYDVVTFRKR